MAIVGTSKIKARMEEVERKVGRIKDFAADEFRKITPIRTGNARSKTNRINVGVEAAYPYANALNDGFSRQAPQGMTQPTVEKISDYVRKM